MAEPDKVKAEEIKQRQTLLFEAFGHDGIYGGRTFGPVFEAEKKIGGCSMTPTTARAS